MSNTKFKYGLNITKKSTPTSIPKPKASIFGDDADDDYEQDSTPSDYKTVINRSLALHTQQISRKDAKEYEKALSEDPTIFDYDAVYDDIKSAEREAERRRKGIDENEEKKPRYIEGLLATAKQRQIDRLRAEEKKIQREREQEKEEFGDTESFVTPAYKAQMEELKRLEEEEKKKEEDELKNKDMSNFYRNFLDRTARTSTQPSSKSSSASKVQPSEDKGDEEAELLERARREGKSVVVNDQGEIVDKRQLLSAGLNIIKPPKRSSQPSTPPSRQAEPEFRKGGGYKRGTREKERATKQIEEQLLENERQQQEEERRKEQELAEKLKRQTTDDSAAKARERYLARKRLKTAGVDSNPGTS
ncbi:uncharacterized protein VTP21DRAFT_3149 [Calcarisporiella thermophila]|uniref:uncharacterized protein n=1 Tax=Calcarisporiella thermophila TaxID=911321 RepID=UPI0037426551